MSRPMTCDEATRRFFSYLDRALAGETLEDLERHLEACLDCCDRLEFTRRLDAFVRDRAGDEPLPDGLEGRLRDRLLAERARTGES
jgi:anti-sigma factor (TIGR02949 family)